MAVVMEGGNGGQDGGVSEGSWANAVLQRERPGSKYPESNVCACMCLDILCENHDLLPLCSLGSKNNSANSLNELLV